MKQKSNGEGNIAERILGNLFQSNENAELNLKNDHSVDPYGYLVMYIFLESHSPLHDLAQDF